MPNNLDEIEARIAILDSPFTDVEEAAERTYLAGYEPDWSTGDTLPLPFLARWRWMVTVNHLRVEIRVLNDRLSNSYAKHIQSLRDNNAALSGAIAKLQTKDAENVALAAELRQLREAARWRDADADEFPVDSNQVEFYVDEILCFGSYISVESHKGWWNDIETEDFGPGSFRVTGHVRWWRERQLPPQKDTP